MTHKQCALCGKTSTLVWRRSRLRAGKYNPTVKKRQQPNLQWVRIPVSQNRNSKGLTTDNPRVPSLGERIKACTKCIKRIHLGKKKKK